jgi:epoxide hydrolase
MMEFTPFRAAVPQADLDDLAGRLARTRWPDEPAGSDWSYGVPLGYLQSLAAYWREEFDWRVHEAQLNGFEQYTTVVDGARVHLVHARSADPAALPLLITHGWPGSVLEFLDVIRPLTEGSPAFHVVAPSIPGYGFSGPTPDTGWSVPRVARAWAALMAGLGYSSYGVQGGDWGSFISRELGVLDAGRVVGVHVNMFPPVASSQAAQTPVAGADDVLGDAEKAALERAREFRDDQAGYLRLQSTRPQTLAYALTDSPVGQLAWVVEKFKEWTFAGRAGGLPEDAVGRDRLLANVTLYWLTRTAGSSARLYAEQVRAGGFRWRPSTTPTGVAAFPAEILPAVRRFAERTDNIVHWTTFDRGGHFAALEEPDLLVADIRAFFTHVLTGSGGEGSS